MLSYLHLSFSQNNETGSSAYINLSNYRKRQLWFTTTNAEPSNARDQMSSDRQPDRKLTWAAMTTMTRDGMELWFGKGLRSRCTWADSSGIPFTTPNPHLVETAFRFLLPSYHSCKYFKTMTPLSWRWRLSWDRLLTSTWFHLWTQTPTEICVDPLLTSLGPKMQWEH